jgi:hypothetical protein
MHWRPRIDRSRFHQGAISDKMWVKFEQLVQLCHAYRYWQQVCLKKRLPPPDRVEQESKYSRKKRHDEWKREIHRSEHHMHNAALLATDKIAEMSLLISNGDPDDTQDRKLHCALRLAIAPFPRPERGRFSAAAFRAFDADCELKDRPEEIASRWLGHAGYRSTNLRDASLLPAQHLRSVKKLDRTCALNLRGTGVLKRTASAEPDGTANRRCTGHECATYSKGIS